MKTPIAIRGGGGVKAGASPSPGSAASSGVPGVSSPATDLMLQSELSDLRVKLDASEKRRAAAEAEWDSKLRNYEAGPLLLPLFSST